MKWLNKAERKFGHICIPNLMMVIVGGMLLIYIMNMVAPQAGLYGMLSFNKSMIMQGQVWRLLTFIFLPPSSSPLFILLSAYFYYLIGNSLENEWGSFSFNVFYFCGVLATIIVGMITGYATNQFINMSLFIAFAAMFPSFQVLLFFVVPIKVKWLAYLDVFLFAYNLILGAWQIKLLIVAAVVNLLIFFGKDLYRSIKTAIWHAKNKRNFKNNYRN